MDGDELYGRFLDFKAAVHIQRRLGMNCMSDFTTSKPLYILTIDGDELCGRFLDFKAGVYMQRRVGMDCVGDF